ncbi:hypothetical protein Gorai_015129, partial [Gossypium raimondii]|nr:hypothetical protein [Gossypium raimondii]
MPKVKTNRVKYPEGWELIEPTLRELQAKMREAENDPHDGKRKCETLWPIFKIAHQKSRYIFDLYHRRKEISKELYEFCLDQGYADRNLIAKWKKPGYERLCCLRCMQPRDHNFATTCVCRVPKHLREEKFLNLNPCDDAMSWRSCVTTLLKELSDLIVIILYYFGDSDSCLKLECVRNTCISSPGFAVHDGSVPLNVRASSPSHNKDMK